MGEICRCKFWGRDRGFWGGSGWQFLKTRGFLTRGFAIPECGPSKLVPSLPRLLQGPFTTWSHTCTLAPPDCGRHSVTKVQSRFLKWIWQAIAAAKSSACMKACFGNCRAVYSHSLQGLSHEHFRWPGWKHCEILAINFADFRPWISTKSEKN